MHDCLQAVAFAFLGRSMTRDMGYLILGLIGRRKNLSDLACSAFAKTSDKIIRRARVLPEVTDVLAQSDPQRAKTLIMRSITERWKQNFSNARRLSLAGTSAYLGCSEAVNYYLRNPASGAASSETISLKRAYEDQQRVARELGVSPDYLSVRDAARKVAWKEPGPDEPIRIGLFDYKNATTPSTDPGDFIQTIGVIGQLSRFDFRALSATETVRNLLAEGHRRKDEASLPINKPVKIVAVNRDFSFTTATEGPIWLPVCGWFAHKSYRRHYTFPFPGNVRPLFMAFHVADPQMLDSETIAYLKRFEPIGCRDLFTARLLLGSGVKAFLNGCVTMTLDRLLPRHKGRRTGRYYALRRGRPGVESDLELSTHLDEGCMTGDFDGNLHAAKALLDKYHIAEEVRTMLLNCYLPCRAMRVPVTLTDVNRADPRFGGIVDLEEDAFHGVVERFEAIAQPVLTAILEGAAEEEVYALWREQTALAMARTQDIIVDLNDRYILEDKALENLALDRIPVHNFGSNACGAESEEVHLLFAFDDHFAPFFPGIFEGIYRHTKRPLRVYVIGRSLEASSFYQWSGQFKGVRFIHYDCSELTYSKELRLPWHISVSTMDRLIVPSLLSDVDKIVYLDLDLIVRKDISELFDPDLGDAPLAARSGMSGYGRNSGKLLCLSGDLSLPKFLPVAMKKIDAFRHYVFSGGELVFEIFNAGVLVMNLAKMRSECFTEKMVALVEEFGVNDQYALNLYARARRKPLAPKWNHYLNQELIEDPAIVHFIGSVKPWSSWRPANRLWKREWQENADRARARL